MTYHRLKQSGLSRPSNRDGQWHNEVLNNVGGRRRGASDDVEGTQARPRRLTDNTARLTPPRPFKHGQPTAVAYRMSV